MSNNNMSHLNEPMTRADGLALLKQLEQLNKKIAAIENAQKPAYYSCKGFSKETNMPESTVRFMCNEGTIKAFKREGSRAWQIPASEINRFKHD